ncbi:unnamed protein product, partial [Rotaria socialis]
GGNSSDWEHTPLKGPDNSYLAEAYWQWVEEQFRQSTYVNNCKQIELVNSYSTY